MQTFVRLHDAKYPNHSWDSVATITRRTRQVIEGSGNTKILVSDRIFCPDEDGGPGEWRDPPVAPVLAEEVLASGLLFFEGSYRDLPLTATHRHGGTAVEFSHADGRPDQVKLHSGGHVAAEDRIRLVGPDGSPLTVTLEIGRASCRERV